MNTNSNVYTVIYTTVVVVLVAAVLAFVSQKLGPMQAANAKAETLSQIMAAAQFEAKDSNAETIAFYKENIETAIVFDAEGNEVKTLDCNDAEVYSTADLKAQNYNIKDAAKKANVRIPVYFFKNGVKVVPVYGAGLWGPVWGYIAIEPDCQTVAGAFFDHASETPGLGGKINEDPAFRAQFIGKTVMFGSASPLEIVKGGAPAGQENAVDAITGATMTSKGLNAAIVEWLKAYAPVFNSMKSISEEIPEVSEEDFIAEEE